MNQSRNSLDGAHQFHLKTSKNEDGTVTVSSPTQPQVPPTTAAKLSTALNAHRAKLEKAVSTGKAKGQ